MTLRRREVLALMGSSAVGLGAGDALASATVRRDVCILGGGAAGTYAALRLRDSGLSVAVLERSSRIGGHAETFIDPSTGVPIDIGVQIFPDNALVRNYFGRFNVPLINPPSGGGGGARQSVDFRTGTPVQAYSPSQAELGAALFTYFQLVSGPFAFLAQNGYQLPSSGPLLDQLLLPFGEFATRNGLGPLLPLFFLYEQGFGSLLDAPTVYVLKNMGPEVIGGVLNSSFLAAPTGVGALYEAAAGALGSDVILNADVTRVTRPTRGGVTVQVDTPYGPRTIQSQKLLITAPPLLSTLGCFDFDLQEALIFSQFQPNYYWTGVLEATGLPPDLSIVNAAAQTPFNLAPLPGIYSVSPSPAPGLSNVKFGSSRFLSDAQVRSAIRSSLERVSIPGVGPIRLRRFATFKSHSPYALMVAPNDIRRGFYQSLQRLQGLRRTYYAGAAFQTHSSAAIWAYIEGLLPALTA